MAYWRLFYHVIWATKKREPLVRPEFMAELWKVVVGKGTSLGALIHAVGGVQDHIHVVASVPPRLALSGFVSQHKGNSSHYVNQLLNPSRPFAWQAEYGVVSFEGKQLDRVVEYVRNQPQLHLDGTIIPIFEKMAAEEARPRPS